MPVHSPALTPRLLFFAGLAGFAAWHYARLVDGAPAGRIVALVALATAAGGTLAMTQTISRGPAVTVVVRLLLVLASFYAGFRVMGVSARLLWPAHWATLGDSIDRGAAGLADELWPYRGHDPWSRLTVLLGLPVGIVAAAAIAFWPAGRATAALRMGALGLLLGVYVIGEVNVAPTRWALDGCALLALTAGWIWAPSVRLEHVGRGMACVFACGAVALALSATLRADQPWWNYHAWNPLGSARSGVFQWDQLYGPISWPRSGNVMFEVSAPTQQLWKVTTLDRFDGLRFLRSDARLGAASYHLTASTDAHWFEQATFTVRGLRSDLVVGAGQALDVSMLRVASPKSTVAQPDGTTVLDSPLRPGDSYSVLSYVPRPTPAQLRRAPRTFPVAYLPYTDFDLPTPKQSGLATANLRAAARSPFFTPRTVGPRASGLTPASDRATERLLLASPYGQMYRLAQRLAAGRRSTYDVVSGVANYLRQAYTYNEHPPQRRYPLEAFLFQDGVGYCQQFSGAMTLMLRMDGIPARVAAGFLPGVYDRASRRYRVRALDSHSWVEVYFDHIGWVPFDPTPPKTLPAIASTPSGGPNEGIDTSLAVIGAQVVVRRPERAPSATGSGPGSPGLSFAGLGVVVFGALITALAASLWLASSARLKLGLSGDAEGAVRELRRALQRLGYVVPARMTLAQLERRLGTTRGPAAGRYVRLLRERRFARTHAGGPTPRDRRALRRALTAHGGPWAWLSGYLALPPAAARRS